MSYEWYGHRIERKSSDQVDDDDFLEMTVEDEDPETHAALLGTTIENVQVWSRGECFRRWTAMNFDVTWARNATFDVTRSQDASANYTPVGCALFQLVTKITRHAKEWLRMNTVPVVYEGEVVDYVHTKDIPDDVEYHGFINTGPYGDHYAFWFIFNDLFS